MMPSRHHPAPGEAAASVCADDKGSAAWPSPGRTGILPGQVWRLERCGVACWAVVVGVDDDGVAVVPVGRALRMADAATVLVPADASPLGQPLAAWVALEARVPLTVFDRPLGELHAFGDVAAVRRWIRAGVPHRLAPTRLGAPITTDADPRVTYRAQLRTLLMTLVAAGMPPDGGRPPRGA